MDILEGNISLNWIDFLLAGIFIFSLVVGTFKGLIKEIFSVVEWVGSIFLAYFFRLNLSSVLPLNNLNEFTKEILSSIIIFICAFIIFRLIGNIISKGMKLIGLSFFDRFLGSAFGAMRALVVLVFIFLISKEELANKEWWEESYFSDHIIEISKLIEEYDVPEKIKGVKFPLQENLDSINKKIQ